MYLVPIMFGVFFCYCTALLVGIYQESMLLGMLAGSGVGSVVVMIGAVIMIISARDCDAAFFES